ncbi:MULTISPECIES: DUF1657 domain-containing protein [Thermaerobacter]|uniref:DUF1657 domain-containing protein n=1 Tax=Thermaerobacter TaxID=73918 RepID=UPI000300F4E0|nr:MULTISPECIES: DUF1657 domain-containing protein [Thermaerobacter]QIA26407.1 DUF1657 domain-containing protein [Thermaerobacter sp. PB12/4term]
MTVGLKMQQTLASAESILADLKSYQLETQDQQAKQLFRDLANQMEQTVNGLKQRLQQIQQQEPQYKQK